MAQRVDTYAVWVVGTVNRIAYLCCLALRNTMPVGDMLRTQLPRLIEEYRTRMAEVMLTSAEYTAAKTCLDHLKVERIVDGRFLAFDHHECGCYSNVVVDYQSL